MSDTTPASVQAGMPCSRCRVDLVMSDRQGIEIDYCPQCRGVWLDRGQLDKIIERDAQYTAAPASEPQPQSQPANLPAPSPWVPQGALPPGYAAPAWGLGYDPANQGGHGGGHGGRHRDSHGGGHGGRGGHNSFLVRLFG